MKKIYLQPEVENIKLTAVWALCGASNDTGDGKDDGNPFGAPQRSNPAF